MSLFLKCHLTDWSFLTDEERGAVGAIHVGHTYVVTVSPVKFPKNRHKQVSMWPRTDSRQEEISKLPQ